MRDIGSAAGRSVRARVGSVPADAEALRLQGSKPERGSLVRQLARLVISFHLAAVLVVDLDEGTPPVQRDDLTFHWVDDPADPIIDIVDDPALVRTALARGDGVNVVTDGGEFAGRSTISFRSFREPYMGVKVTLAEGETWVGESFTVPEFRRRGVGAFRSAAMMANLASMGVHRVYASVEDWNAASRGMSQQSGFRHLQDFRFVRVFRRWGFPVPGSATPKVPPLVA